MLPFIIVGLLFTMGIFAIVADDIDDHKDDWKL